MAVIGATGAVGRVFLRVLEERRFPLREIRLCASKHSVGKRLAVNGLQVPVEETTPDLFDQVDIVFISANGDVSRQMAPLAVKHGALVIDDSSAFRMQPDVPLVVPEVNGDDLDGHHGIIAIPNCTTTPLVMVLQALGGLSPIRRVVVDTYQSVSGTGAAAMRELEAQSRAALDGKPCEVEVYPHQIAFNVLPQVDAFQPNGYTKEEMKVVEETRKILHKPRMRLSATCVRVPVMVCHSEAVHVEFQAPVEPDRAREALAGSPGIRVLDDPQAGAYPLAIDAAGKDEVFVGRIRRDLSCPSGLAMWLVSDNLRKGAAVNAIQIAEEVLRRDLLLRRPGRV